MDLSKAERQATAEQRRSTDAHSVRILLRDILCFFLLLSLGLLILTVILCVAHNVTWIHQQQQRDQVNGSRADSVRRCFQRGFTWLRSSNCHKAHPQQEAKLEQLQEPEQDQRQGQGQGQHVKAQQFGPQLAPTYQPINHPQHHRRHSGGDPVEAEASAPEPKPILADNF